MTDMVFGAVPAKSDEPILPEWWRTVDRWSLAAIIGLFIAGLLLCLAASPPLAVRNGLDPFHYVWRQAAFGAVYGLVGGVLVRRRPRSIPKLDAERLTHLGYPGRYRRALVAHFHFGIERGCGRRVLYPARCFCA